MEKFNKTQNFNYDNKAGFSPEDSHLNWEEYEVLKNQAKWNSETGGNVQMNLDDIGTEYIRNAAGLITVMDGSAERYFRSDRLIRDGEEDVEKSIMQIYSKETLFLLGSIRKVLQS